MGWIANPRLTPKPVDGLPYVPDNVSSFYLSDFGYEVSVVCAVPKLFFEVEDGATRLRPRCKSHYPRLLKPRGVLEHVLGFLTISRYQFRGCATLFYR